jgi:hypothetical protein
MTYRVVKGSYLSDAEIEANYIEADISAILVTPKPIISGIIISNFNPLAGYYSSTFNPIIKIATGEVINLPGVGSITSLEKGKILSNLTAVQ